jgi:signal transduction histidine kinase/DNA-binding response OmpR family regulator
MDAFILVVEGLYLVLFLGTLFRFLRDRDPVSRDLSLIFSALGVGFVAEAWEQASGAPLQVLTVIGAVLLIAQPVVTLHLVSLVRPVRPAFVWGSAALLAGATVPLFLLPAVPEGTIGPRTVAGFGLVAIFVIVETTAAAYLLLEAIRREGPVAVRMGLAAISTGVFASALFASILGSVLSAPPELSRATAAGLALLAGIGYLFAFLAPAPIRRIWQARTTVDYTQQLIAGSSEPVPAIWSRFTDMAVRLQGGSAVMIVGTRPDPASIVAATGIDVAGVEVDLDWEELDALVVAGRQRWDVPTAATGPIRRRLAEHAGARFVSTVQVEVPNSTETAVLVLLSSHRALFHSSDAVLLAALGAQTAIVAERRAVVADQEALAERLALTVEALRSASAAKSDFVASMSHEFRTPLSAIIGFSDLMSTEPRDGDKVSVPAEWVEHIQRGGQHLLALVNDVLDLARVEAGRLDLRPEPVDVGHAVIEAVNGLRPLADRKNLALEVATTPVIVNVDRGRFRQILYNLISNAIKYTHDGGSIRVGVTLDAEEVRIAVADSGIGIAPEDHGRVFEEFRQVGDPSERQPGSGLGLAVTKRLAEAHRGRIDLTSARGQGSTFTLVLPTSEAVSSEDLSPAAPSGPTDAASAAEAVGPPAATVGDILVIEDDPSAVRLLREYLEGEGYRVRVTATGELGIESALKDRPAAIILDVLLPGMDGWEVLRRLKADDRLQGIPVVIVTVVEEREVGLALGAVDYLVKPIHREVLLGCIARYVSNGSGRTKRVLVVDDEPAALSLIRGTLEPEGVEVVTAQGGREALNWADRGDLVDMVICDLVMPDVDGFAVISALKQNPRTASLPIVVYTAHDLTPDQKNRLNGQILGIVAKGQDARVGLLDWLEHAVPSSNGY